jgi:hypothetical protein
VGADNLVNTNVSLHFGRGSDPNGYGNETLDEIRISNVARYSANFVPATGFLVDPNTVAYWRLNEGTGLTVGDATGQHNGTLQGNPLPAWVLGR